ncbi:MAG: hypothetical protein M1825_002098 [Sarcosagium campestre]|nr:MAG: hypothetical protein M1825_002098 [Sarcosagium campestre]
MSTLRPIDEERKALLPSIEVPNPEPANESNGDVSMTGTGDTEVDPESLDDLDDELPHKGRSLRRGDDRAAERKRKREEEREKKERAETAVKPTKEAKLYKRLTGQMEEKQAKIKDCESEMARLDDELREADCPRTRCLGKDRFWNRYWWFERNGMPYAGLPDSSTAEAGYANGRIWVQGPDADEYEGFINLKGHDAAQYLMTFHLSVLDRKLVEEQGKSVFNARQWGFIDEPEDVDKLIGYLDVRGDREVKLRKELQLQRDIIVAHMARRKAYLDPAREMSTEDPPARMSTRTKHQVDHSEPRCLSWRNTTALSELGRLHSEAPRPRKIARKSEPKGGVERVTRGIARTKNGKPTGRQGTRYTF